MEGREGGRGREGGGGREREGGRRKAGREGGREGEREGGREGGAVRKMYITLAIAVCTVEPLYKDTPEIRTPL